MKIKLLASVFLITSISSVQAQVTTPPQTGADLLKSRFGGSDYQTESDQTMLVEQRNRFESSQLPTLEEEVDQPSDNAGNPPFLFTPLYFTPTTTPTAYQLPEGTIIFSTRNRIFSSPGDADEEQTPLYPSFSPIIWGITDQLQITVAGQSVDSGRPGQQGNFNVIREEDAEAVLDLKYRLWENPDQGLALSGVVSVAGGRRQLIFRQGGTRQVFDAHDLVPAVQLPLTYQRDGVSLTFSPTIAFFPEEHALFIHRPPIADPGEFGTTFGISGAASYIINPRLMVWGDGFVPLTGNNSLDDDLGKPAKSIVLDAGLRYFVNPRVALDLFASNRLGTYGPLALTAESQDEFSVGFGLMFMPDFSEANRSYASNFDATTTVRDSLSGGGLAYFDGDVLPANTVAFDLFGGTQGISTAVRYGFVNDLEAGAYLDYAFGDVDESEQGFGVKVRLLDQHRGSPFTASIVGTVGLTNQPFANFVENDPNAFENRGLDKDIPLFALITGDDGDEFKLFITTLSVPLHYQFENNASVWLTPMLSYVQRNSLELAGLNVGGSYPVNPELNVIGEVGANFVEDGNMIGDNGRENAIPWTVAFQWQPENLLGQSYENRVSRPNLNLFFTNRVGFSPWQSMRVQHDHNIAVGVGLTIPVAF
jgi:hypothetical protein